MQPGSRGGMRGNWLDTTDSSGDTIGFDTIRLHNTKGSFIIAFNNAKPAADMSVAHGSHTFTVKETVVNDSGSFAGASETGTITLKTNAARTLFATMTLKSTTA